MHVTSSFKLLSQLTIIFHLTLQSSSFTLPTPTNPISNHQHHPTTTSLHAALKPASQPLLTSGKALAVSGEALIDLTTHLDLWGGGLSAVGANVRNAGDCIAQAAASCRFKTGLELVCDELREGATCLDGAVEKGKGEFRK